MGWVSPAGAAALRPLAFRKASTMMLHLARMPDVLKVLQAADLFPSATKYDNSTRPQSAPATRHTQFWRFWGVNNMFRMHPLC